MPYPYGNSDASPEAVRDTHAYRHSRTADANTDAGSHSDPRTVGDANS